MNNINNFKKLAKKYDFSLDELESSYVTPDYGEELEDIDSFPADITEVKYIIL